MKVQSTVSALAKRYGGKWKYSAPGTWECDDGVRYVSRVLTGVDMNGEYTGESSLCLYYNDDKSPEWVQL